jgi:hypothetical protein
VNKYFISFYAEDNTDNNGNSVPCNGVFEFDYRIDSKPGIDSAERYISNTCFGDDRKIVILYFTKIN